MPASHENPTGGAVGRPSIPKGLRWPFMEVIGKMNKAPVRAPGRADSDLTEWLPLALEELRAIYTPLMDLAGGAV